MSFLAIDDLAEGLFGTIMAFLILAGMIGVAWGAAWLICRPSKCAACGWREGHRPDCSVLNRLVDEAESRGRASEDAMIACIRSGALTRDEAMALMTAVPSRYRDAPDPFVAMLIEIASKNSRRVGR